MGKSWQAKSVEAMNEEEDRKMMRTEALVMAVMAE